MLNNLIFIQIIINFHSTNVKSNKLTHCKTRQFDSFFIFALVVIN